MDKQAVIDFLKQQRQERIEDLAKESGFTVEEIEEKLSTDPKEVYEWDDGDQYLEGLDTVLYVLED